MINTAQILFEKYRRKSIIVDSNILLLYALGKLDKDIISRFKRTSQFTIEDYELLALILDQFKAVLTTPNILTEVSNLANQMPQKTKEQFHQHLSKTIQSLDEKYCESRLLAERDEFISFGLTDTGIVKLSEQEYLVLTDDFRLAQSLAKRNIDVINFNHIRVYAWK